MSDLPKQNIGRSEIIVSNFSEIDVILFVFGIFRLCQIEVGSSPLVESECRCVLGCFR